MPENYVLVEIKYIFFSRFFFFSYTMFFFFFCIWRKLYPKQVLLFSFFFCYHHLEYLYLYKRIIISLHKFLIWFVIFFKIFFLILEYNGNIFRLQFIEMKRANPFVLFSLVVIIIIFFFFLSSFILSFSRVYKLYHSKRARLELHTSNFVTVNRALKDLSMAIYGCFTYSRIFMMSKEGKKKKN